MYDKDIPITSITLMMMIIITLIEMIIVMSITVIRIMVLMTMLGKRMELKLC